MEIFKIAGMAAICVIASVLVRQYRPELSPFVGIAGVVILCIGAIDIVGDILSKTSELAYLKEMLDEGYIALLAKVLGIAVVTQLSSDLCRDSGNSAIADSVEFTGRAVIIGMSFSLIRAVAELAGGLLK